MCARRVPVGTVPGQCYFALTRLPDALEAMTEQNSRASSSALLRDVSLSSVTGEVLMIAGAPSMATTVDMV